MLLIRVFKSVKSVAKQKIAIISEATEMSNPSSLGTKFFSPDKPISIFRSALSFKSTHLFHVTCLKSSSFPWNMWLSIIADNKLFAEVIAWISPVKCKFISSIGATCACPPPVAPPFIPNTGPSDGSLNASIDFLPIFLNPSARPIDIVVLPSPNGVGLIDVTRTRLPSFFVFKTSYNLFWILALYFP